MLTSQYYELAMRTAKDMGSQKLNLIHAAMGLSSDAGEFTDAIKKYAIYGKELDLDNAVEELGDCMWFIVLACHHLDVSLSAVMIANIQKLEKRYPERYSDERAITRLDKADTNGT